MVSPKKEMKLTKNSNQKNDYYSNKLDTFPKEIFNIYEYNINRWGKVSKFWGCFVSVLCNNFFQMGVWCCGCHTHTHTHTHFHALHSAKILERKKEQWQVIIFRNIKTANISLKVYWRGSAGLALFSYKPTGAIFSNSIFIMCKMILMTAIAYDIIQHKVKPSEHKSSETTLNSE